MENDMKDFKGRPLRVGDHVHVASTNVHAAPLIEECVVKEISTLTKKGAKRKVPILKMVPADKPDQQPTGVTEAIVARRVALIGRRVKAEKK